MTRSVPWLSQKETFGVGGMQKMMMSAIELPCFFSHTLFSLSAHNYLKDLDLRLLMVPNRNFFLLCARGGGDVALILAQNLLMVYCS